MLHALELENFKAFGERARIPFAPITLIFGENSAGKSTILQALYLLKQTLDSRESDAPLLSRTENGIVDLGSFQEMLFDRDLKRTLSIRVETIIDEDFPWPIRLSVKDDPDGIFHARYLETQHAIIRIDRGFDLFKQNGEFRRNFFTLNMIESLHLRECRDLPDASV